MDVADTAQDGDTIPALLAMPDRIIAKAADRLFGKLLVGRLQFLEAHDVGLGLFEPPEQHRQAPVYTIHIVGRDLHRSGNAWLARPQSDSAIEAARCTNSTASPTWK